MCKTAMNEKIIFPFLITIDLNSKKAFVDVRFCNWNKGVEIFKSHESKKLFNNLVNKQCLY